MIRAAGQLALLLLLVSMALCLWRLVRGPSAADRVLALDTLTVNLVAVLVVLGVLRGTALYFESALVMALLGFVATVVLCRTLLRRELFD